MDTTDDYCQQLVAEQRLVKASGRVVWIKTAKHNHFLGAEALNAAAAHSLVVHTPQPQAEQAAEAQPPQARQPQQDMRRNRWVSRTGRDWAPRWVR